MSWKHDIESIAYGTRCVERWVQKLNDRLDCLDTTVEGIASRLSSMEDWSIAAGANVVEELRAIRKALELRNNAVGVPSQDNPFEQQFTPSRLPRANVTINWGPIGNDPKLGELT